MTYKTHQHFYDVNGFKIAYTVTGAPKGRTLFCIAGLLSNGRDFDFLAQEMAERGYRVIAMDLPGRGLSDSFTDPTLYTVPSYIPYVLALIAHEIRTAGFDWLGVSLGGIIGIGLVHVEHLNIERLILVDIGAEIPAAALNHIAQLAKMPTTFHTHQDAVIFLKARCSGWGITQEHVWEHLITHNITQMPHGFTLHYDPAIGQALVDDNQKLSFWDIWTQITQPVLLVRGAHSTLLPIDIAQKMDDTYTGQDYHSITFPGCGHVPNLMQDDYITPIAQWLQ